MSAKRRGVARWRTVPFRLEFVRASVSCIDRQHCTCMLAGLGRSLPLEYRFQVQTMFSYGSS